MPLITPPPFTRLFHTQLVEFVLAHASESSIRVTQPPPTLPSTLWPLPHGPVPGTKGQPCPCQGQPALGAPQQAELGAHPLPKDRGERPWWGHKAAMASQSSSRASLCASRLGDEILLAVPRERGVSTVCPAPTPHLSHMALPVFWEFPMSSS